MKDPNKDKDAPRDKRAERFQFSANRGGARHKVRYVESGGGKADKNCKVCQPVLAPQQASSRDSKERGK